MTIDKEQLISLLEEKTGLEREQVEAQLSELINRIQKAAEDGKTFEVEGFGTFSMEEGRLQFEPGDTLETEINNKYAGMKPIELIGAFKEPESDEEVPDVDMTEAGSSGVDTEHDWAFDSGATESEKDEDQESETVESEPELDDKTTDDQEITDSEGIIEQDQQEAEEVFNTVFGKAGESSSVSESLETEKEEVEAQKDEADENDSEEEVVGEQNEKPRDTIGTVIVAVVVVLVVGIGGWLMYDFGFSGTGSSEIATTSPQPTETVDPVKNSDNTESEEQSDEDEEAVEPEQPSAVSTGEEGTGTETAPQQQDRYGLMGEPNQAIANGYTIVVHSLRDQQQAEQNRQQLQGAGYRALISQAQVEGTTYYRVGIGQFETVGDAQQATGDIPEQYRDNNFIKRIQ
ncbi:hypothetical protein CK503_03670 [Aliifodinibius salipaludis]|uniref:SPOR domain-containing protein n=1 Tax=Fodinibius salipaludis TaxID=2032627 RepID=A0A2A2GEJ0_9BACT|nr:SPOR domain-containing protein [Aliifodinibius salipaludis]PAU95303.1 hypothetical protein CK503_03670 [Aliifodinibius salipaludis]